MKVNLREQQKQQTRIVLMEAAMRLFAEQGYENVTLNQIAEHAGIHVQTLFKHFKTKVSLATSYFDFYLDLAINNLAEISAEQDALVEVGRASIVILKTIMKIDSALAMFQMIHANEELLASTQHRLRIFEDELTLVLAAQAKPQRSEIAARLLAAMMVSAYRDAHFSWIRSNGAVNSANKYQAYFDVIQQLSLSK